MDELALVAELRASLSAMKNGSVLDRCSTARAALKDDPDCSDHEAHLFSQLRSQVSDVIAAASEGLKPHTASASDKLTGLETSIRKRTARSDG